MWVLQAPDFDVVRRWRWQQERSLQALHPAKNGLDRAQIERFVQLFERVSRHALRCLPHIAQRTIRLARSASWRRWRDGLLKGTAPMVRRLTPMPLRRLCAPASGSKPPVSRARAQPRDPR
ncbi:MAG TPA: hypothetical protein VK325_07090 [Pseudoxanthomonas sp.]|nr:hypothetical protein [Pseudoxanthomonas sp.]